MNFDISKQSKRPDWKHWTRLGSVSLRESIFLSLDVCPIWYENTIINYRQKHDSEDYRPKLKKSEIDLIVKVFNYIEPEFSTRLQVAKSWTYKQDWVLDKGDFTAEEINEGTLVDLKKFFLAAFTQMQFKNEYDEIPSDLYVTLEQKDVVSQKLSRKDWISKAREYGEGYLNDNPAINLNELAKLIYNRFLLERILTAHGGREILVATIKTDALSKGAWFSISKRNLNR